MRHTRLETAATPVTSPTDKLGEPPERRRPVGTRACVVIALLSAAYLTVIHFTIGVRPEHIALVALYLVGLVAHPASARFILAFTVFVVYGVLYDALKIVPSDRFAPVDIEGIYRLERYLFGIGVGDTVLTPNEFFARENSPLLDIVAGAFYINWVSVPLLFAFYLFKVDKHAYLDYALVFLLVNLLGFAFYYLHPAAPPWYVEQYGFAYRQGVQGSAAELVRFDRLLGANVFQTIYTRNSNVFAAVPSLHSAYPVIVLFFAEKRWRNRLGLIPFAVFMVGIWFAAVYSGHHYVIDVILGALCAVAAIALYYLFLARKTLIRHWITRYEGLIS